MLKADTLYTVNKWNKPLFDTSTMTWNNPYQSSLGSPYSFGNTGLTTPTTSYVDWKNPVQTSQLMQKNTQQIQSLGKSNGFGNFNTNNSPSFFDKYASGVNTASNIASPVLTSIIGGGYSTGGVGEGIANVGQAAGNFLAATGIGGIAAPIVTFGSAILGGLTNRALGTKKNQKNINTLEENAANARNAGNELASASDSNSFFNAADSMVSGTGFKSSDLVKGGWFSGGKAKREAQKYLNKENRALAMQRSGMVTGAQNVDSALDDNVMYNFAALGGPIGGVPMTGALGIMQTDKYIDAINNRSKAIAKNNAAIQTIPSFSPMGNAFADGGGIHIKPSHRGLFTEKAHRAGMGVQEYASHVLANKENYPSSTVKQANFAKNASGWKHDDGGFVNTFMQDPIQAAMQYMQQQDALEAQQEAQKAALAQQAEYDALQQRLANAETQNEGLQALLNSQGLSIQALQDAQMAGGYAAAPTEAEIEAAETANEVVNTAVSKNKNWNYIRRKLKESGKFNNTQIEGIRLNLQRESNFNPNAVGDGGKAFGLGQWHPDRQPKDRSFNGQINHLINTLSAYDGSKHWIGRSNYEGFMNARTPEEAHYYIAKGWERPAASITEGLRRASNMSLRKKRAFGGELGTNGTDFTTGLLEINTGNSHEANPHDGVQLGVDYQGIPNLVEEGETVYNDYVFSNRMNVPAFMRRELGLGGAIKKDITFAQASKKLAEASKERPNSPIDQAGLDAALGKLAQVQEAERMKMQAEEQNMEMEAYLNSPMNAFGGNLFAGGGYKDGEIARKLSQKEEESIARSIFGDNAFGRFMENTSRAISDPVGYFAGDEIDAIASKLSKMSQPAIDRFFKTSAGQAVAKAIVWADDNLSTNSTAREAGIRPSKAVLKAGSRVSKAVVDGARRSMKASQLAARGQVGNGAATMARGKNPAIAQGIERAQAAKKAAETAAYNKRLEDAGFKLIQNGEKAASSVTSSGYKKVSPKGGRGVESTSSTGKLNRNTAAQGRASKAVAETYPGQPGSVPFAQNAGKGASRFAAAAFGAIPVAGAAAHAYSYLDENLTAPEKEHPFLSRLYGIDATQENNYQQNNTVRTQQPTTSQRRSNGLYYAANGWGYRTKEAADLATKKYNDAIAARNAQATRNQGNAAASAAPVRRGLSSYTNRIQAPVVNDNAGDIVAHKYDWYRNGSDGLTENPWGFTVGDNGLINTNSGYTQEYRDLVNSLGANDIRRWAAEHPNDPSLQSFLQNNYNGSLDAFIQDTNFTDDMWRAGATDGKYGFMHHVASQIGQQAAQPQGAAAAREYHLAEGDDEYLPDWSHLGAEVRRRTLPNGDVEIYHASGNAGATATMSDEELGLGAAAQDAARRTPNEEYNPYPTWMRYVPAVGSGIMALTDLLGLTNKPDYTYADKLEAAANRAGYAPNIRYNPIGNYLRYQPMDIWQEQNRLNANSRATDRALINTSVPNGSRMAGLLANEYNNQLGSANLYRQALEYNDAKRQQVADFNRRTDMFNSQMDLEAAMANARYRQQAQQAQMSGLSQAAAMRDAIDQRIGAARSANITNLLNNIGMIGRENFAFNQINSDRSRRNALKSNGVSYDKIAKAETAAFGENLNKKKQGRRSK